MENEKSVFELLNAINVNDRTEKKGKLTYLSWAWAWAEVKKAFPDATYTIYENPDGWNYFTDGRTCWVKTGLTINGLEHIEYLPVMYGSNNNSIPLEKVTSFDVNKAIQRSLTKAAARHGLGLYIYAGEDLPEAPKDEQKEEPAEDPKEEVKEEPKKKTSQLITETMAVALANKLVNEGIDLKVVMRLYKVDKFTDLTVRKHNDILENIAKIMEVQKSEKSA